MNFIDELSPKLTHLPGIVLPQSESSTMNACIASGEYASHDDRITLGGCRLTLPPGPRELYVADFGEPVWGFHVMAWAFAYHYTASPIDDLLAVGSHPEYRELQQESPIISIGQLMQVDRGGAYFPYVPYLGKDDLSRRALKIRWYGFEFSVGCLFLLHKKW